MSVELRPLGVRCNLACRYCYQQPQRDAGNTPAPRYDLAAMKDAILAEGGPFTLFGGEPLLPLPVLDDLWAWGLERFGGNGIQTKGTLITDAHLALFRRYRVRVGISVDGPGELNDARVDHTPARTRRATARTEAAIARLCAAGMPPSLIVTLHRGNAVAARLPALHDWFRRLASRQLAEMLSWPLEWSARHGIAEGRTPVLKLAHRTDATSHTLRIAMTSPNYPAEGATGLRFPYRTPRRQLPILT